MDNELAAIKSLISNGAFGAVTYVTSNLEEDVDKGTQFASIINFIKVTVNNGSHDIDYHLVLKKKLIDEESKEIFNSEIAFNNEVMMYRKILPLLEADKLDLFPKLYTDNEITENILIFENLQEEGFVVTKEKLFLDYEHIKMTLRKLGEFHALSYLAKQQKKDKFFAYANDLTEIKFTTGNAEIFTMVYPCMVRGIQPLIDQNIQVDTLNNVVNKLKNFFDVTSEIFKPEEPFSVICHGDFCRNNMFFKYDNNDKPIDIRFFDLQNSIYTSPAIDLGFFLYMNTSAEMRDKYWDEFLKIYWNAIINLVPNVGFTFEQFLEHFAKRVIYGYYPTSFFLPLSMDETVPAVQGLGDIPMEEWKRIMLLAAGERGTKAISDIVKHLLLKNYLNKFLEL